MKRHGRKEINSSKSCEQGKRVDLHRPLRLEREQSIQKTEKIVNTKGD